MAHPLLVAKVGGSLYDLPDLGPRLRGWLASRPQRRVLLLPGGGSFADVVRNLDAIHGVGEEASHWLALQAMSLGGSFLARLLPEAALLPRIPEPSDGSGPFLLDAMPFFRQDEQQESRFPHRWQVTSDSLAVRVAIRAAASELVLLKSVEWDKTLGWPEAARADVVDTYFPTAMRRAGDLRVEIVNLRTMPGDVSSV